MSCCRASSNGCVSANENRFINWKELHLINVYNKLKNLRVILCWTRQCKQYPYYQQLTLYACYKSRNLISYVNLCHFVAVWCVQITRLFLTLSFTKTHTYKKKRHTIAMIAQVLTHCENDRRSLCICVYVYGRDSRKNSISK